MKRLERRSKTKQFVDRVILAVLFAAGIYVRVAAGQSACEPGQVRQGSLLYRSRRATVGVVRHAAGKIAATGVPGGVNRGGDAGRTKLIEVDGGGYADV